MKSRKRSICWKSLSKLFQDAIVITRSTGHRFLWIDSLCIVQDDDDDWRDQASRMDQIYENASLTIAATRASSGAMAAFQHEYKLDTSNAVADFQINLNSMSGRPRNMTNTTCTNSTLPTIHCFAEHGAFKSDYLPRQSCIIASRRFCGSVKSVQPVSAVTLKWRKLSFRNPLSLGLTTLWLKRNF